MQAKNKRINGLVRSKKARMTITIKAPAKRNSVPSKNKERNKNAMHGNPANNAKVKENVENIGRLSAKFFERLYAGCI